MKTNTTKDDTSPIPRTGSLLIGAGLLLFGTIFLVSNLTNLSVNFPLPWPLFIIGPGLVGLVLAHTVTSQHTANVLAVLGAELVCIGLLLGFMLVLNRFEMWAYAWPLLFAAGAAGHLSVNRTGDHQVSTNILKVSLMAVVLFAVFFELIIFNGNGQWWPLILIISGLFVLVYRK